MASRRAVRALACLTALAALAGCQGGLQFKNDHRLAFEQPEARQKVTAPVTVRWTMRDFDASGLDGSHEDGKGVFAVFVDRAPMPVGKDLRWLFRKDAGCARDPRCPSEQQLRDSGVIVTSDTSVTIDVLPQVGDGVGDEQHYVNVVLLDGSGRRSRESAWYLPFTSKRRST